MSSYHKREIWKDVYDSQDFILKELSKIDSIFLGGGTALHRFIFKNRYRESDDIDFFIENSNKDIFRQAKADLGRLLGEKKKIDIQQIKDYHELGVYRLYCKVQDKKEIIKVELIDKTNGRYRNCDFITSTVFPRIENAYNLMLYKLAALCDRYDTVKDLFDLYFIFRENQFNLSSSAIIADLNLKFQGVTTHSYNLNDVIEALKFNHRQWDILERKSNLFSLEDLKSAIEDFKTELIEAFDNQKIMDLSYLTKAKRDKTEHITFAEYYKFVENNSFVATHAMSVLKNKPMGFITNETDMYLNKDIKNDSKNFKNYNYPK